MSNLINWSLAEVWNQVAYKENKPLQARDYVYASEIGMPMYDRYLKMRGVPYTNPPNDRSLRKFLAGNVWEHVTKQILIAVGVYHQEEVKIDAAPYADCLSVHGRCDFVAGGYVDEETAVRAVSALNLPDFLVTVAHKLIDALQGKTLIRKILELKSVSTFAMDKVERVKSAMPNHSLQAYHYQKNGGILAEVCYICKDDCRMAQFPIDPNAAETLYRQDLEKITHYFKKKKEPPKEQLCVFDEGLGKFSKNLGVEYSPYLSHYGFKNPDAYRESVSFIDKWNRALARYALAEMGATTPTGKPIVITPKNADVKIEIEKAKFDFKKLLQIKLEVGEVIEEEAA